MVRKQLTLYCAENTPFITIYTLSIRIVRAEENQDHPDQLPAQHNRLKDQHLILEETCL
jgi:hypothetical protein